MTKPEKSEYDAYYERYVSLVPDKNLLDVLAGQPAELTELFRDPGEAIGSHAYADGKWTVKELLSHLVDAERMFAYRAFRISRGDTTPIEGFEQDGYIENSGANGRSILDLVDELRLLREANLYLFKNLDDIGWVRMGTASALPISVRALAYISAGHITHHINILKDRYLQ